MDFIEDLFIYKYDPIYNRQKKYKNFMKMDQLKKKLDVLCEGDIPSDEIILESIELSGGSIKNKTFACFPKSWENGWEIEEKNYIDYLDYVKLVKYFITHPENGFVLKSNLGFEILDIL